MVTITKVLCDVCKANEAHWPNARIPVRFLTEQTEGKTMDPHLSLETMDICDPCMQRLVSGLPLNGYGAQGHNTYEWRK